MIEPLLDIHSIAEIFGVKKTQACEIVARPGFPPPVTPGTRHRKWLPDDVRDYLKQASERRKAG